MSDTMAMSENVRPGPSRRLPWIAILVVALLVQLAAAVWLASGQRDLAVARDGALLEFDRALVERIRIERVDAEPLELVREPSDGSPWRLPALADVPAAPAMVEGLLDRLAELRARQPVATSLVAQARFRVAETAFEGRVTLLSGDGQELAVLYLGDSAGFRRQYVRAAGDLAVHEVGLGPADIQARPDDWVDRTLLHRDERDIQSIAWPGFELERDPDGPAWRLVGAEPDGALDQARVAELVGQLARIPFSRVVAAEAVPKDGAEEGAVLVWRLGLASGETPTYRLARIAEPNGGASADEAGAEAFDVVSAPERYLLEVSDRPYLFELSAFTAERLFEVAREDLLRLVAAVDDLVGDEEPDAEPASGLDEPTSGVNEDR
ncbi:DUF4340 domain-containing protein [Thioalkalicoccus limnaeus]|uniref:DUF4340 domain-containing protein n=1 Tax=Thioalkalicoccus limnaeus TaxID=120681 RepID=A0ABV4BLJ8_9GAMM